MATFAEKGKCYEPAYTFSPKVAIILFPRISRWPTDEKNALSTSPEGWGSTLWYNPTNSLSDILHLGGLADGYGAFSVLLAAGLWYVRAPASFRYSVQCYDTRYRTGSGMEKIA